MTIPLAVPSTQDEFVRMFPNEEACDDYLFLLRWPGGFVCKNCGTDRCYTRRERRLAECVRCMKQWPLTDGTSIFRSHTPLLKWFYGAFLVTGPQAVSSATRLQRELSISRYETALYVYRRLRAGADAPGEQAPFHAALLHGNNGASDV